MNDCRARWGGSGALHLQPAIAGPNALLRFGLPVIRKEVVALKAGSCAIGGM